jgi:hypothetical protein
VLTYAARRSLEQIASDDQEQELVEDALDWAEPSVDGSRIAVTVDEGVVTLRGIVDTPAEKLTAERVALRVRGVDTVINHLTVSSQADDEATHVLGRSLSAAGSAPATITAQRARARRPSRVHMLSGHAQR